MKNYPMPTGIPIYFDFEGDILNVNDNSNEKP